MKIHHLRSATCVIEAGGNFILVDPMLGEKATIPPFAFIRHKPKKNPTLGLPENADEILGRVTHCLVTHCRKKHLDHLDAAGKSFLRDKSIPTTCLRDDAKYLEECGIEVANALTHWQETDFPGGRVTAVPALHGHGWVNSLMVNGAGFYLALEGEPSIYISGDTVLTDDVKKALLELKPDVAVVAAGCASLDVGGPILMPMQEIIEFASIAPEIVVANHMEALNHCEITREKLRAALLDASLLSKTVIPDDGDTITITPDLSVLVNE